MRGFVLAVGLSLAAPSAWADTPPAACTHDVSELKPIAATRSIPPYPPASMALGEEGRTTLKVVIGADGVPIDVGTTATSGSDRLDQAAESWVKQNWRWQPPMRDCKPVKAATTVSIIFHLEGAPPDMPGAVLVKMAPGDFPPGALERHEHGSQALLLVLDAQGAITRLRQVSTSGYADLDALGLTLTKARHWAPMQMDGRPVASAALLVVEWPNQTPPPASTPASTPPP